MARAKLPKWAIRQAGGINKKAWRLARAGRKRSSPKSRKARANPKRKGGNTVARRKKNFNINLIDLGGGLVLADQFLGPTAMDSILKLQMPDLKGLPGRLRQKDVQEDLVKTGLSIAIIKTAARGLARQVGAIGPVKLKI